jgi:hypothetical protein
MWIYKGILFNPNIQTSPITSKTCFGEKVGDPAEWQMIECPDAAGFDE